MAERFCLKCGTPLFRRPRMSDAAWKAKRYCSVACMTAMRAAQRFRQGRAYSNTGGDTLDRLDDNYIR